MQTKHLILYEDARNLSSIKPESINLVVTSPPYPMITMWDDAFSSVDKGIKQSLKNEDGDSAYKLMHAQLDKTWLEVSRVLKPGGFACINIGDATRTIGKVFKLYPNHVDILNSFIKLGFHVLPEILWRKPTNSPTKFMGSGMLPCGAYVTQEHERIMIFRKPALRNFNNNGEKLNRRKSSYFWEERNIWFSDFWDLIGARQTINSKKVRKRSGAFPLEIPLRLIRMYSSMGDTILDPFLGTATTTLASIICARNSIGVEIDTAFQKLHTDEIPSTNFIQAGNFIIDERIQKHLIEMKKLSKKGKTPKYKSKEYEFPVMTRQEVDIEFKKIGTIDFDVITNTYFAQHHPVNLTDGVDGIERRATSTKSRVPRSIYKK